MYLDKKNDQGSFYNINVIKLSNHVLMFGQYIFNVYNFFLMFLTLKIDKTLKFENCFFEHCFTFFQH